MMGTRVFRRLLWLTMVANLLSIGMGGAAGTALAQGKEPQKMAASGPYAPTAPYALYGDTVNSMGGSSTRFRTSNASEVTDIGWDFQDTSADDTTLHAYGAQTGVHGEGNEIGIYGTSGSGVGVAGEVTSGVGVYGISTSRDGVLGHSESGVGVYGISTSGEGVHGSSSSGIGVYGSSIYNDGVSGAAGAVGKAGVLGYYVSSTARGYGVRGYTTNGSGYGGYFSGTTGIALFAGSTSNHGLHASSTNLYAVLAASENSIGVRTSSKTSYALYATTDSGSIALRSIAPSKASNFYAGWFDGNVRINGSYVATGTKSALVYTNQGERLMYAEEATQNYFSDMGTATLKDGRAVIKIDPLFAQTVNLDKGYMVFATPATLDTLGLGVTNQSAGSFEVGELGGGKGNFSFHWRITALRKGYEKLRMELAPAVPAIEIPAEHADKLER